MSKLLKYAVPYCLFSLLLVVGCDRTPPRTADGTFIDQPGEYWGGGESLGTFKVIPDPDGNHLKLDHPSYPGATVMMNNYLHEGWFLYLESPDRLWVWDGEDRLERGLFTEEAQIFDSALITRGVKEEILPEVLARLPESMKEQIDSVSGDPGTESN